MLGMTALKTLEPAADIPALMHALGRRAKAAGRVLALAPTRQKDDALAAMAQEIRARAGDILAGNAAILRGGSESHRSNIAIHAALVAGVRRAKLPEAAIELIPTRERAAVGLLLSGLDGAIDVIVPRGGKSLVARVQNEARVPVFAHLEGVCHVYVDKSASLDMAKTIVLNAKMRRTGVCGAAETLLVDRNGADRHLRPLIAMLLDAGCEVRGDEAVQAADTRVKAARAEDWSTEHLDALISAKVVDGVDAAIDHIEHYGSHHTDSIVTEDKATAE